MHEPTKKNSSLFTFSPSLSRPSFCCICICVVAFRTWAFSLPALSRSCSNDNHMQISLRPRAPAFGEPEQFVRRSHRRQRETGWAWEADFFYCCLTRYAVRYSKAGSVRKESDERAKSPASFIILSIIHRSNVTRTPNGAHFWLLGTAVDVSNIERWPAE